LLWITIEASPTVPTRRTVRSTARSEPPSRAQALTAPPLPATARGLRARAEIERAARSLFASSGYLRTTVADIATASGRSSAAFYQYFDSKEQLLVVLGNQFNDEVAERTRTALRLEAGDDQQFFRTAVGAYWDAYEANRGVMSALFQLAMMLRW